MALFALKYIKWKTVPHTEFSIEAPLIPLCCHLSENISSLPCSLCSRVLGPCFPWFQNFSFFPVMGCRLWARGAMHQGQSWSQSNTIERAGKWASQKVAKIFPPVVDYKSQRLNVFKSTHGLNNVASLNLLNTIQWAQNGEESRRVT